MEFKQTKLENGLTIIGEAMPTAKSLAMGFFVSTGSRDETPEISGTSHFLEHMLFKGTPTKNAFDVNLTFDRIGAQYNAFTSEENTVYYGAVLPEFQTQLLSLWSDLMRPSLRQEDFDTEKGVICEEINMYKDIPNFDVIDNCRRNHFGKHPSGYSVLGTEDSVNTLKREQMQAYFDKRYSPDNIVLCCAGNVNWDAFVATATELCGHWQKTGANRKLEDYSGTGTITAMHNTTIQREHICLIASAPSAQSNQRYAASLLSYIIGDVTGSRLYWDLVDTALCDSCDMEFEPLDGGGTFYTYASCDPSISLQVIDIIRKCFSKVKAAGVTEQELQSAKNKIASSITLHGELPMGRLVPLGFGYIYRNDYKPLSEELKEINKITTRDINALLSDYPLEKLTITGLGPCENLG